MRSIPVERLVFIDEAGLNLAMTRSHAWVKKGTEYIERTPMNWGPNLGFPRFGGHFSKLLSA